MKRSILIILASFLVLGCSSLSRPVPDLIKQMPQGNLQLAEAMNNVDQYKSTNVRWGGTVIDFEKKENISYIQILHSALGEDGKPYRSNDTTTDGRFMVAVPDPENAEEAKNIYIRIGSKLTVNGDILGEKEVKVGKELTKIPVISAHEIYTWGNGYRNDDYHNPIYDPFYYRPYYRYHFFRGHYYRYWHHRPYYYPRLRPYRCY